MSASAVSPPPQLGLLAAAAAALDDARGTSGGKRARPDEQPQPQQQQQQQQPAAAAAASSASSARLLERRLRAPAARRAPRPPSPPKRVDKSGGRKHWSTSECATLVRCATLVMTQERAPLPQSLLPADEAAYAGGLQSPAARRTTLALRLKDALVSASAPHPDVAAVFASRSLSAICQKLNSLVTEATGAAAAAAAAAAVAAVAAEDGASAQLAALCREYSRARQELPCVPAACIASSGCSRVTAYVLRLRPGSDLLRELAAFCAARSLRAAYVASCVGSLSRAALRCAGRPGAALREEAFEICSLVGTLGAAAPPHLHLTLSDGDGRCLGGHVLEGCTVRTTAEVVLAECTSLVFDRPHDAETTYDELRVRARDAVGAAGAAH